MCAFSSANSVNIYNIPGRTTHHSWCESSSNENNAKKKQAKKQTQHAKKLKQLMLQASEQTT